jgi:hypothetical protein
MPGVINMIGVFSKRGTADMRGMNRVIHFRHFVGIMKHGMRRMIRMFAVNIRRRWPVFIVAGVMNELAMWMF